MRSPLFTCLLLSASLIFAVVLLMTRNPHAYAGNETIEDQVAGILSGESAQGKIKILILDFRASSADTERNLSEKELKDRGAQFTEEFTAHLIHKINVEGKRDKISIFDRSRLDDNLREKNLPITPVPERTITEIGRIAGVDVIIAGILRVAGNSVNATAKVVRVKDGEILDIVKEDRQVISSPIDHTPVTLIDKVEELKIGSSITFPLNLVSGGTLSLIIEVVRGNPIDVNVIPGSEWDNFKGQKKFKSAADFTAAKMKSYKHSADLDKGDYYLVVRDSSLGIFSAQRGEIKIIVQLKP